MAGKKILWLCSWYPGKTEPFNGDFIQRHARAAALYNDIHVIYVTGDSSGAITTTEKEYQTSGRLTEHRVYFKKSVSYTGRIIAHFRWLFLFRQAIRKYMIEKGKPDLVHVQVPYKAGLLGRWLLKKYRVPYVLTEHWGIYNDVEVLNYAGRSSTFKKLTKKIFSTAAVCISVSRFLADGVNRLVVKKEFTIIPNVVDTDLFYYKGKTATPFRFIHVSNMVPLKNAEGILRAFKLLLEQGHAAELHMVGDTQPSIRKYAADIGLTGTAVSFYGEIPYTAVATKMQEAHSLIVNSTIENSPCVIGEALCCGLPVIVTKVGGVPELVDSNNAILMEPGNDAALAAAMLQLMKTYQQYDIKKIAENARGKFSYPVIGKQFDAVYSALSTGTAALSS